MFLTKRSNPLFHVALDSGRLSEEARVGERNASLETTWGAVITIFLGGNGVMAMEAYATTQQPPFATQFLHELSAAGTCVVSLTGVWGTDVVPLSGVC